MGAIQVFKSLELIFFEREIFISGTAFVICGLLINLKFLEYFFPFSFQFKKDEKEVASIIID